MTGASRQMDSQASDSPLLTARDFPGYGTDAGRNVDDPARASRLLEETAGSGDAGDVEVVLADAGPFETRTIAFAIAVARGEVEMARLLGTKGDDMVKSAISGSDYGDFVVCGGGIAMSGYTGHPHFPDDYFQIEVDGSNCKAILELSDEGYFGDGMLTSMVSSCLYEVGRFGQELRKNENYYLSHGRSRYSEEDIAAWREKESLYLDTAEELCKIAGSRLDVARLLEGRLDVSAYDKVTSFLCDHFPDSISAAWMPSRWRFGEHQLGRRETANLKIVFPHIDPAGITRPDSFMRCLAINGMTDELRQMRSWPGMFTEENLDRCMDLASSNGHPDTAAYLLDCKSQDFGSEEDDDLLLL